MNERLVEALIKAIENQTVAIAGLSEEMGLATNLKLTEMEAQGLIELDEELVN